MRRERLTITLRDDLLRLVDATIDGAKIRNRSHAIESLLLQILAPKQTRVLVLAGGKGINFRPFTYELPKALIPIRGRPLLEHTLVKLREHHLTDIVISVGHLGEKIREYFGSGERWGLKISYLDQKGLLPGTAQPLKQAEALLSEGPFLLVYGDVLADLNFYDLLNFHQQQKGTVVTMALASVEAVSMWGLARLVGNRIIELEEKPHHPKTKSHLVNAGIYVMQPGIFKYISKDAERLEKDVFPRLAEEGRLAGYAFEGDWFDVSTPQVYEHLIREK